MGGKENTVLREEDPLQKIADFRLTPPTQEVTRQLSLNGLEQREGDSATNHLSQIKGTKWILLSPPHHPSAERKDGFDCKTRIHLVEGGPKKEKSAGIFRGGDDKTLFYAMPGRKLTRKRPSINAPFTLSRWLCRGKRLRGLRAECPESFNSQIKGEEGLFIRKRKKGHRNSAAFSSNTRKSTPRYLRGNGNHRMRA